MDEIDYAGVIAQLQHENEGLRRRIVTMYWNKHSFEGLSVEQVKTFVAKNYLLITVAALALFTLCFCISTVRELFAGKESK